ncbi:hypothetical protein Tco_1272523 [Tanacetum coccineum]
MEVNSLVTQPGEYGLAIPETMLTEAIKQSKFYQMFIKYSTCQIPQKKSRGKGSQGKSISLTEVEEVEATRKVHARIMTESIPTPAKRSSDTSQKLKGVQSLTPEEQEAVDTMKELKESRKSSKRQPVTRGSHKGTGSKPGVPNEPAVGSTALSEGTGVKPGVPDEDKDITKEKVILEWGEDEDSEHDDDDNADAEKDDKDDDVDVTKEAIMMIDDDDDEDPSAGPNQGKIRREKKLKSLGLQRNHLPQELHDRQTVVADYFFNNDLEYLKSSDPINTYTTSITKTKAARYTIFGIKDMVLTLWSPHKSGYDKDVARGIKHWVEKLHGYGYLDEIMVKRADRQLYKFKEGNFVNLHLNDIEDMLLLSVQHKLFHLNKSNIVDLIVALRMFTRSLIIKRRVEDLQLGVESYKKKLNITAPQKTFDEIECKEIYTPSYNPPGVVYEDQNQ